MIDCNEHNCHNSNCHQCLKFKMFDENCVVLEKDEFTCTDNTQSPQDRLEASDSNVSPKGNDIADNKPFENYNIDMGKWQVFKSYLQVPFSHLDNVDISHEFNDTESSKQPENANYNDLKVFFESFDFKKYVNNNNKKIIEANIAAVEEFEKELMENNNLLQNEKYERLKVQEEMCEQLDCERDTWNKNALLFLKLCSEENFKHKVRSRENIGCCKTENVVDKQEKNHSQKCIHNKNFVKKNIELATTAMSKVLLTDNEKRQLDQILSDINKFEITTNNKETSSEITDNEEIKQQNAFHLNHEDKKRISEIDSQLETSGIESLKTSQSNLAEHFWKNVLLEQMLKEVDKKLALYETDHEEEFIKKLTSSEKEHTEEAREANDNK